MTSLLRLYVGIFLALMAFAANSVLNRLALADGLIDPGSFTLWRLLSGAITLMLLCLVHQLVKGGVTLPSMMKEGSWTSATALFVYAVGFSYAYITILLFIVFMIYQMAKDQIIHLILYIKHQTITGLSL